MATLYKAINVLIFAVTGLLNRLSREADFVEYAWNLSSVLYWARTLARPRDSPWTVRGLLQVQLARCGRGSWEVVRPRALGGER